MYRSIMQVLRDPLLILFFILFSEVEKDNNFMIITLKFSISKLFNLSNVHRQAALLVQPLITTNCLCIVPQIQSYTWCCLEYLLVCLFCAYAINREFAWSPTDDVIAFWVPEDKDSPARVTLMEIPSRKEIRVKNLFNVSEVILCVI